MKTKADELSLQFATDDPCTTNVGSHDDSDFHRGAKESITTLKAEIEALDDGIRALDKEYTEQREEAHTEYTETRASNNAAIDLPKFAMHRLNKFYNPKLYNAPAKRDLSEEGRITVNFGSSLAPTSAPGGIAGTGVGLVQLNKAAPPPPPETRGAYNKNSEGGKGVSAMMDLLLKNFTDEMTEMQLLEKQAQEGYDRRVPGVHVRR